MYMNTYDISHSRRRVHRQYMMQYVFMLIILHNVFQRIRPRMKVRGSSCMSCRLWICAHYTELMVKMVDFATFRL